MRSYGCQRQRNQRWNFVGAPNGANNVQGIGGLCLDVHGGSTADGARVNEFPCGNDKPNQTFRYHQNGHIREVQSNKCLTVNPISSGSALFLQTCESPGGPDLSSAAFRVRFLTEID